MYIEFDKGKKHSSDFKNADKSESHEYFQDAGRILEKDDVVIDLDKVPREILDKMIEIFEIKTQIVWTDRGCHLYFKKKSGDKYPKANGVTALGIEAEYKHTDNTYAITIKRHGVPREIENEGKYEPLPDFIKPVAGAESLLGLSEGDGRNPKLHSHKFKIQTLDNKQRIFNFINQHVFAEPMEESEFKTVTRYEKVKADPENKNYAEVAREIIHERNIVYFSDQIYFRENKDANRYVAYNKLNDNLTGVIEKYCNFNTGSAFVNEVFKKIKAMAIVRYGNSLDDKVFDIQLKNGILRNGRFEGVEYEQFTPFYIDVPYKENAKPVEIVDQYLDHMTDGDEDYKKLLLETMAHTLIVDPHFKRLLARFSILVGKGGEGKGTFLGVIRSILGGHNASSNSIKDLTDPRYLISLKGKLANLGDDIQDEAINNNQMKILKNISTADNIELRELYQSSESKVVTTSLIFASNSILKSFEKGDSFQRRVKWLPIMNKPKGNDPSFIPKLTSPEAKEYWMKLIYEAYERLYEQRGFTKSEIVEAYNDKYHEDNNNVKIYLDDFTADDFLNIQPPKLYEQYEIWAEENGVNVQSKKQFTETACDEFDIKVGIRKIGGKSSRVFVTDRSRQGERTDLQK